MKNVTIFDHPLIQHKTTLLRKTSTTNKEFRELVEEITMLMCYESLRDFFHKFTEFFVGCGFFTKNCCFVLNKGMIKNCNVFHVNHLSLLLFFCF